jgi:hypothetical protein
VTGVVSDLVAKVTPSRPSPWGEPEDADDGWTDEGWSNEQAWSADPADDDRPDDGSDDGSDDEPDGPAPAAKKVRKIQVD